MKYAIYTLLAGLLVSFAPAQQETGTSLVNQGEQLEFKAKFGWFTIGRAEIFVDDQIHSKMGKDCYRVDIIGKTAGMAGLFGDVNDRWGSYLSTDDLMPQLAYRFIREGNYERDEITFFRHDKKQVEVKVKDKHTGEYGAPEVFEMEKAMHDMIGGFMHLRTVDFSRMKEGDMVPLRVFNENTVFDIEVTLAKREVIKTKLGKVHALKLLPRIPENDIFDGEDAVVVWLSDDENKVPLLAEAKMPIGTASVEINEVRGLAHPLRKK